MIRPPLSPVRSVSCASLFVTLGLFLATFVPAVRAADAPLVERFDFGTEELGPLIPRGGVVRDQVGPRPPEFPNMEADNTAVQLKGNGARFEIKDPGPQSRYKFTNGDAITLEAWIKVESLRTGQPAYIIGKGARFRRASARIIKTGRCGSSAQRAGRRH